MSAFEDEWSRPDLDGIRTRFLYSRAKSTLHGRRVRRAARADDVTSALWPRDHVALLRDWLAQETAHTQFSTLLKIAGHARAEMAGQVLEELLRAGWIEIEERRAGGTWKPVWVRFLDPNGLRPIVGLPDRGGELNRLKELKDRALCAAGLSALRASIERLPVAVANRRMQLLIALDAWIGERRFGTRRDFALNVTGDTKGIPESDWTWLEAGLNLEDQGIRRHVPLLHLRAPWSLHGIHAMDLRGATDCIGLSPRTLARVERVEGRIETWCLIENRTLFDRVAEAYGDRHAVLWCPGNPPVWWIETVAGLLKLCPASALIACDPDPAGIEIAMAAGNLWHEAQQPWRPWGMSVESLKSLSKHRPLSEEDDSILDRLSERALPPELRRTADWMREQRLKGEQEGLTLQALEREYRALRLS